MLQCYCLHVTLYRAHVLRVPFWSVWGPQEVWKSFTLLQFLFVPSEDKKKTSLFLPWVQTRVRFIWESASPQSRPSSSGTARWWGGALFSRRRRNNLTPAGSEGDIFISGHRDCTIGGDSSYRLPLVNKIFFTATLKEDVILKQKKKIPNLKMDETSFNSVIAFIFN